MIKKYFIWIFSIYAYLLLRKHIEEREASERKTESLNKKLQELFSHLNVTIGGDLGQPSSTSFDNLMARVR